MEKYKRNKMRIVNWLEKLNDEDHTFNDNEMIRKINIHLTETEKEINFGEQLLNEQDITVAFPQLVNKKKYKHVIENALFNRPLNIHNYKKIEFPIVSYNPRKKNENNVFADSLTVKALLTKVEKYNLKRNKNSVSCVMNNNNNKKILPPIIKNNLKLPPINKIINDNEQNKTFISTIFKNTSCENFNVKNTKENNIAYYSPMLHKNLDSFFDLIDDKTTRTNELSEKIKEGIKEINDYKLRLKNKKCFTVKKSNINRIIINREPFDVKDRKKFPIISNFDNLGRINRIQEIQEIIYKNVNKKGNKLYGKDRKNKSKKNKKLMIK